MIGRTKRFDRRLLGRASLVSRRSLRPTIYFSDGNDLLGRDQERPSADEPDVLREDLSGVAFTLGLDFLNGLPPVVEMMALMRRLLLDAVLSRKRAQMRMLKAFLIS